ncbi:MAG: hypothetical protein ABIK37_02990 [candidate division WOR-3 bacterium]
MRTLLVLAAAALLAVACVTGTAGVRSSSMTETAPHTVPAEPPIQSGPGRFELPPPLREPVAAPGDVAEPVPGGTVDWGRKVVRARGTGVVDPGNQNLAQARLMAERAAVVVAQRNLLEIVKGVRVDSDTKVENFMTKFDVVYSHVDGVVRGARQVGPAVYDEGSGTVEVELEIDLTGPQSVAGALSPALGTGQPVSTGQLSPQVQEFFRQYSGLVLEAGNSGLKPSLFPKIYDESGNLLLDTRNYFQELTGQTGITAVQYVERLDQILSRPEFSRNPLVLKVKQVTGRLGTDIILSRPDADKLKWLKDGAKYLLDAGRLLVRLLL